MNTNVQANKPNASAHPVRQEFIAPEVDIFETKDGYVLEAEMPGVNKNGLEISLEGNEITITGRRQAENPLAGWVLHERRMADYRRIFELDPVIDAGKIEAKLEQGILTLTLPKSERVKPRKIAVND